MIIIILALVIENKKNYDGIEIRCMFKPCNFKIPQLMIFNVLSAHHL